MTDRVDMDRRATLKGMALLGGSMAFGVAPAGGTAGAVKGPRPYWHSIREAYPAEGPLLNLNNAAVCPAPFAVQQEAIRAYQFANEIPDVHLWDELDTAIPRTTEKLSVLADCEPEEVVLNRNTTEGMSTVIFGMPLSRGDEVIVGEWDYSSMIDAWKQRVARDGIVLKTVRFDLLGSDDAIVDAYADAITSRTKAIQLTHLIHWTGRVVPVDRICAIARQKGILTVVDAAQSFAQMPLSFRKMGCDYLATSLHKWLCAPFGTGMLIVRKSRVEETWPLLGLLESKDDATNKFGGWNLGTFNSAAQYAIGTAVDFHNAIGTPRIHERLRELSRYWVGQARDIEGFRMHTPIDSEHLGAVTLFSIEGVSVETMEKQLQEKHRIRTRLRRQGDLAGVRVSPHIYTLEGDLDRFVDALRNVARAA